MLRFWIVYTGPKTGKERTFPAKPFRSAKKVAQTCNRLIDDGFASACRIVTEKPAE